MAQAVANPDDLRRFAANLRQFNNELLNQMTVVGLVSLPGMMTGQVLAGQHPEQAVRYQIVVMFLLAAASAAATVLAVAFASRRLFTPDHRFVASRLVER